MSPTQRVRLELDQRGASALHAALAETLGGGLLSGDRRDAARELFEQLEGKVPDWLSCAPVGGEAGYLIAAEAVLRALVDAEDQGCSSLVEIELLHALGDAKPLGASAADVLGRMRREQLICVRAGDGEERRWTAAPAGRQFLHRDTAAREDAWTVSDADALLDLIYAEHHPDTRAHRPSVQAIGRLEDAALGVLLDELLAAGMLDAERTDGRWLELSWDGYELARSRWQQSSYRPPAHVEWAAASATTVSPRAADPDRARGPRASLALGRRTQRFVLHDRGVAAALKQDEAMGDAEARWRHRLELFAMRVALARLPPGPHPRRPARIPRPRPSDAQSAGLATHL